MTTERKTKFLLILINLEDVLLTIQNILFIHGLSGLSRTIDLEDCLQYSVESFLYGSWFSSFSDDPIDLHIPINQTMGYSLKIIKNIIHSQVHLFFSDLENRMPHLNLSYEGLEITWHNSLRCDILTPVCQRR